MARVILSEAEKLFILEGIDDHIRCDGRSLKDFRPMELETDVIHNANGSAHLRLANTDVLVGVKTEIDKPSEQFPNHGKINFFVDCSANAAPEFVGRGGEKVAKELVETLHNAYESPLAFDLKILCILPGRYCWKLYVDILILQCGGNLFDAVSIAIKAAIFNTRVPRVTPSLLDVGEAGLLLSDDPSDCMRFSIDNIPILVTICQIGKSCVVDPSAEEEQCRTVSVIFAISKRNDQTFISHTRLSGRGSFDKELLSAYIKLACAVGEKLNNTLNEALLLEVAETRGKKVKTLRFLE